MPTTVNGIGTSYVGKKNIETRRGICEHCGREAAISTYDTKLFFVVVFIPLIPLGTKKVLDHCASCNRHRVLGLDEWHGLLKQASEGARKEWEADPDNPAYGYQLYDVLITANDWPQAMKVAHEIASRYPDQAEVQYLIGTRLESKGHRGDARKLFERASELLSEDGWSNLASARLAFEKDDLELVEKNLRSAEEENQLTEPALWERLGDAWLARDNGRRAAEAYREIARMVPKYAALKSFKKKVKRARKAGGDGVKVLPERPWYKQGWLVPALVCLLLVVGPVLISWYAANHRKVYAISGLPVQVVILVDGEEVAQVPKGGRTRFETSEGEHQAVVKAGTETIDEFDFSIPGGIFDRLFGDSVHIVNVAGSAPLLVERSQYSAHPGANGYAFNAMVGTRFLRVSDVDYEFEPFPETIQLKNSSSSWRTRVTVEPLRFQDLLLGTLDAHNIDTRMTFAETHLNWRPELEELLNSYVYLATIEGESERAYQFLLKRVEARDAPVNWHRTFQEMSTQSGALSDTIAIYDKLVEHAAIADHFYLRARIEPNLEQALAFYQEALEKDPDHAYANFGIAHIYAAQGKSQSGLEAIERAAAGGLRLDAVLTRHVQCLQLSGRLDDALTVLRTKMAGEFTWDLFYRFVWAIEILEELDRPDDLQALRRTFRQAVEKRVGPNTHDFMRLFDAARAAAGGDLEKAIEVLGQRKEREVGAFFERSLLIEAGWAQEAETLSELHDLYWTWDMKLALSVSLMSNGNSDASTDWRGRAIGELSIGGGEEQQIAQLLAREEAIPFADFLALNMDSLHRGIVLAAIQWPESDRDQYLDFLEKVNLPNSSYGRMVLRALKRR